MTFDEDPPRLRTLKGKLPRELQLVLEDTRADDASAAELSALEQRVRKVLRESERALKRARSPRPRAARGRIAAVVFTFALGAVAGVAGSSAVFFVISANSAPRTVPAHAAKLPPPSAPRPSGESSGPSRAQLLQDEEARPAPTPTTRESARAPVKTPAAEPSTEPSSLPPVGTRDEFAVLARAQAALASNPGSALALTSDLERNFPNGTLVQEREVVAIDALLRLGRRAEANARAARFHRQFPTSVHGRRIDVLLGSGDSAGGAHR